MNLLNCVAQTVTNHLGFLIYYLNPLVTEFSIKYQKIDKLLNSSKPAIEFLIPIIILLVSHLYGTVYVVYADEGHFGFETLKNSPVMMYHQVVPQSIWPQLDLALIFVNCTVISIYGAFLAKKVGFTAGRYQVNIIKKKNLSKQVEVHINEQSKVFTTTFKPL